MACMLTYFSSTLCECRCPGNYVDKDQLLMCKGFFLCLRLVNFHSVIYEFAQRRAWNTYTKVRWKFTAYSEVATACWITDGRSRSLTLVSVLTAPRNMIQNMKNTEVCCCSEYCQPYVTKCGTMYLLGVWNDSYAVSMCPVH